MKNISVAAILFLALSCKENPGKAPSLSAKDSSGRSKSPTEAPDSTWISSFNEFRAAIYQGNKTAAKHFFDFPILSENNDIWYLVFSGNEKQYSQVESSPKPFTEKDFDTYFPRLFSKEFISSILKIKTKDLYTTGRFETSDTGDTSSTEHTSYKIYADFDRKEKTLLLNLSSIHEVKDDDGEWNGSESSTIYKFEIINNSRLKLKHIYLAG